VAEVRSDIVGGASVQSGRYAGRFPLTFSR